MSKRTALIDSFVLQWRNPDKSLLTLVPPTDQS